MNLDEFIQNIYRNKVAELTLSEMDTFDRFQRVIEPLRKNTALKNLKLSTELTHQDAVTLAEWLKSNATVTSLELFFTEFQPPAIEVLAQALTSNTKLTELGFLSNHVGSLGAKALAQSLKINKTLTSLALYKCQLTPEEFIEIAEALKVNSSLTHITLSRNSIGSKGAALVAEVLKTNSSLKFIDLEFNKIDDAGVIALIQALHVNSTLLNLHLRQDHTVAEINTEALKKIEHFLMLNRANRLNQSIISFIEAIHSPPSSDSQDPLTFLHAHLSELCKAQVDSPTLTLRLKNYAAQTSLLAMLKEKYESSITHLALNNFDAATGNCGVEIKFEMKGLQSIVQTHTQSLLRLSKQARDSEISTYHHRVRVDIKTRHLCK